MVYRWKYITNKNIPKEFLHLREQSQLQVERNHSYYNKNVRLYDSLIAHIVEQIRNSEYISQKTDVISGQRGRLDTTKVWRAEYIEDNRIFTHMKMIINRPLQWICFLMHLLQGFSIRKCLLRRE